MGTGLKRIIQIGSIVILFAVVLGYGYFRAQGLIRGVEIVVDTLKDGQTLPDSILEFHGSAKNAVKLTLDNRLISVDQNGVFSESLLLPPGYTIMKLEAQDKFGKTVDKTMHFVLKANSPT